MWGLFKRTWKWTVLHANNGALLYVLGAREKSCHFVSWINGEVKVFKGAGEQAKAFEGFREHVVER